MPIERTKAVEPAASRLQMQGYNSPEGPDGVMPWRWAEQRLEGSHNYWLATVRQDGRPHLMIVWGLWLRGVFYFSTGSRSRKARNLESNAQESQILPSSTPSAAPPGGTADTGSRVNRRMDGRFVEITSIH